MFNNIDEALNFVMNCKRDRSIYNAERISNLLNNPIDKVKTIHIAGTNGKGSTLNYLRSLLQSDGYKVGTFSSPHYLTHLDRIRINDEHISEASFLKILNDNLDLIKKEGMGMFDIDFTIASIYFLQEKVDYALIEVGIGGRNDCTNVIKKPELAIITSIAYDHTEILGDSLEKIAYQKVGIAKKDCPLLISNVSKEAKQVIEDYCQEIGSSLFELQEVKKEKNKLIYRSQEYILNTKADYQFFNASLALEAMHILNLEIKKEAISEAKWAGRYEIVNNKPLTIIDGAHNPEGIKASLESFKKEKGKKAIIFAALKRKSYQEMIDIAKKEADFILCEFNHYDCLKIEEVADKEITKIKDWKRAYRSLKNYDAILICGSLYFISEVAEYFLGNKKEEENT